MFSFLESHTSDRIQTQVELVSIHIPKTAGTSFRNILKKEYGDKSVIRLDINLLDEKIRVNENLFSSSKLSKKIKVVHGHFSPALLKAHFDIADSVPMITWLRHPADRVISNYYYLEKRLKEELNEEKKGLNILSKMQRSLMEYASDPLNQNRISKFLNGVELSDLFFVGIQEHYGEDLDALGEKLNWIQYEELRQNATGDTKRTVRAEDRAEIERLNAVDMELYRRALDMRRTRIDAL